MGKKTLNSLKCPQCNLVNFATAEVCKRCGTTLLKPEDNAQYARYEADLELRFCTAQRDKELRLALDTFRFRFQQFARSGSLSKDDWTALEGWSERRRLDLNVALAFVREEMVTLVRRTLEMVRADNATEDDQRDLEQLIQALAIPEYYVQTIREIMAGLATTTRNASIIGEGNAAILCDGCGAGVVGAASATDYACSACSHAAVLRHCPACSRTVAIQQELWGSSVKCKACGCQSGWRSWNSSGVTLGELAATYEVDQVFIADPSRRAVSGVVIGGFGYPIGPGIGCELVFMYDKVVIYALVQGNYYEAVAIAAYVDVTSLQVGGRGAITTTSGGGWSGGGFGLTGFLTGALVAGAMNSATTKTQTSIESVIHFRTIAGEIILSNNNYTPEHLNVMLSPAFTRIESAHRAATSRVLPAAPSPVDPIHQLHELAELRNDGTFSESEFLRLKAAILRTAGCE